MISNNTNLNIRISKDLKDRATEVAHSQGMGLSEWLKKLMEKEIWRYESRH